MFSQRQSTWGQTTGIRTRSSAVAERPRDASCLSVVSFNSKIRTAQSFSIGYFFSFWFTMRTIKFCSVVFGVTSRLFCHKQDSLMRGAAAFVDSESWSRSTYTRPSKCWWQATNELISVQRMAVVVRGARKWDDKLRGSGGQISRLLFVCRRPNDP